MNASLAFFLPLKVSDTEMLVESFKEEFDALLKDSFSDEELESLAPKLDTLGAIFVGPLSSELTFDDFYADSADEAIQRSFFKDCRSTITVENLPYLETNPFQVTYLKDLIQKFSQVLIDRGGVNELMLKESYLQYLSRFKDLSSFIGLPKAEISQPTKSSAPVDPIDFLIRDVFRELDRLDGHELPFQNLSPKLQKIYLSLKNEKTFDATYLLRKSGLNAKDFDDGLEIVKFWLRKLP